MTVALLVTLSRRAAAVVAGLAVLLAVLPGARAEPVVVELAVVRGALPEAQRVIRVRQGDDVVLRWTTDRPLAIHLHGYDIERALVPGIPTELRVNARAAGRFAISVHQHQGGREATLAHLEVHPK